MDGMFYRAPSFNQDISGWDVSRVTIYSNFRYDSPLTTNYTPPAFR